MTNEELAKKCAQEIKQAIDSVQILKRCAVKYPREIEVNGEVFDFEWAIDQEG